MRPGNPEVFEFDLSLLQRILDAIQMVMSFECPDVHVPRQQAVLH
jgi:hypothetical protein